MNTAILDLIAVSTAADGFEFAHIELFAAFGAVSLNLLPNMLGVELGALDGRVFFLDCPNYGVQFSFRLVFFVFSDYVVLLNIGIHSGIIWMASVIGDATLYLRVA